MIGLLLAAAVSMVVSLIGTRFLILWLTRLRIGQPIRDDGPQGHALKAGTPTMGGLAIVVGAFTGYMVSNLYRGVYTRSGIFVILAIVGGGAVGLLDDWIKVVRERNLGLNKRTKMLGLLTVAITFGVLMVNYTSVQTTLSFTRYSQPGIELGSTLWVAWAVLLIVGSSNAVNLTDGLDGLAAGASTLGFAAFVVMAFWQFRYYDTYQVAHALDLAIVAAAMVGGCIGFLWWNAAPAQIFMGDTGSLAIGTGLAALALATNTQLLLPIVAGLFVMETVSVILQVGSFRLFGGRRIFRMAPVHHHFELGGWPETTVIVRFWIISGLCTAVGLGLFYADSIKAGVTVFGP
ncbi:MAG: phospho-N-acetylmuramoyl-pentapeptide-transferase [Actinobacteria bacterium]|jgi:phospho-N-acetylmuramoyl-pentapeptide-transferase|nr:phospho-N-acetylmuramoyl-pentapeptide-transferase [Actinomycetota bacterium]MBT3745492.1 phospho-N-acetylmuramoyl-pentapeptide-transferase [Actinomycetota bacterium]MBT3969180.1 phospho-N-acetylmuramoyl-pentapeptide-transferase [Actinomycetota bacterium]MBT4009463.1 phospho-N-acetylmuramoyl-pentapeptide-transferase [Actinomycetota bacterium]MBT4302934.1 phospho-N-acetylmuramoyl-pentapeptide-transferase [Actinomycetota bacterium]